MHRIKGKNNARENETKEKRERERDFETQQVKKTYSGPGSLGGRGGRRLAEAVKGITAQRWSLDKSSGLEFLN